MRNLSLIALSALAGCGVSEPKCDKELLLRIYEACQAASDKNWGEDCNFQARNLACDYFPDSALKESPHE